MMAAFTHHSPLITHQSPLTMIESSRAMADTKTILLVDDDREIIAAMRTVLEGKGYRVLTASDGNAGLAVAERENPHLVVVIMITANEGSRHRAYAEMLGVDDYLRKPFSLDKLLERVQELLKE